MCLLSRLEAYYSNSIGTPIKSMSYEKNKICNYSLVTLTSQLKINHHNNLSPIAFEMQIKAA